MKLVDFDENLVSAALQRMKKWLFALARPAEPGHGCPGGTGGSRGCVKKRRGARFPFCLLPETAPARAALHGGGYSGRCTEEGDASSVFRGLWFSQW